ncbi:unnamed protein product [Lactuca saligna]|uniref:Uncharacterized protein n=1 Tax=Lactuca saligna TaxID=75948 RepID=A0AA35Z8C0_LACSI|nr:unnamed protein product [Lactuca saligna]
MHHLIASTIHHRGEHDKVPSGDLFPLWCLLHSNVHLHIPYTIASFLSSSLALGTQPWIKICSVQFINHLAQSYRVDTYGMTHNDIRDLYKETLRRLRAVVRGPDQILRIPTDDVVVPIRQVESMHGEEREFEQGYRQQRVHFTLPTAQRGL